jgi:hypothetical protein
LCGFEPRKFRLEIEEWTVRRCSFFDPMNWNFG